MVLATKTGMSIWALWLNLRMSTVARTTRRSLRSPVPTTSNLQYASVGVGEVSTSFEASVPRAVGVGGETARGIPSRSIIEMVMVNVLRLTLTALQLKPVALSADV